MDADVSDDRLTRPVASVGDVYMSKHHLAITLTFQTVTTFVSHNIDAHCNRYFTSFNIQASAVLKRNIVFHTRNNTSGASKAAIPPPNVSGNLGAIISIGYSALSES